MKRILEQEELQKLSQIDSFEGKSYNELAELVFAEEGIANCRPDGMVQIDPRNGERIVYNTKRAKRPHDNAPDEEQTKTAKPCVICEGRTTGVIDIAPLSEGSTFINKNLFPILYPEIPDEVSECQNPLDMQSVPEGSPSYGFHFLQWTSTHHDKDWQNMPKEDRLVCVERMAALEMSLLYGAGEDKRFHGNDSWGDDEGTRGFVSIIKNYGRLVGGSLEHGHQQIAYTNVIPRKFLDNKSFEERRGEKYSQYMWRENPDEYTVRDYGCARLVVPYFMRRPYDMQLIFKDTDKRYLFHLEEEELQAMADGWHDAIGAMLHIMPRIGREAAYNVVVHAGPGAGIYVEFLPYTQETGGYEHAGLFLCQGNPRGVVKALKEYFKD